MLKCSKLMANGHKIIYTNSKICRCLTVFRNKAAVEELLGVFIFDALWHMCSMGMDTCIDQFG